MSGCIPTINPDLSIPELIEIAKHSFRECEFNEVQDILMQREKNLIIERERKCEELENKVLKLGLEVEELKRQAQVYKNKYESLNPRMSYVEMSLANMLNVRVEDLPLLLVTSSEKGVSSSIKDDGINTARTSPGSQDNKGEKPQVSGDVKSVYSSLKDDGANMARTSPGLQDNEGEELQVSGDVKSVYSSLKDDGANMARTSPGLQDNEGEELQVSGDVKSVNSSLKDDGANMARTSPGLQDNEGEELQVSGPHEHDDTSLKMASSAAGDVIVISDSDDDVSDTYSGHMYKSNRRRRSDHEGGDFIKKTKRSISLDDDALIKQHIPNTGLPQYTNPYMSPTAIEEINNVLNGVSTDSDDDESSYSDAEMDNLVATIRSKTLPLHNSICITFSCLLHFLVMSSC